MKNAIHGRGIIAASKQMATAPTAADVAQEVGVSEHKLYFWYQKYRGMNSDEAKWLKQLEEENRRLHVAVADLTLDEMS